MNLRRYFHNTSWMLLSRVVRLAAVFFTGVLVARHLGTELFGRLSFSQSFVMLFSSFCAIGMNDILVRELEKVPPRGGEEEELIGTAMILRLGGSLAVFLLVVAIARLQNRSPEMLLLMGLYCLYLLLLNEAQNFERCFEARVQAKYSSLAQLMAIGASCLSSIVMVILAAPLKYFAMVKVIESLVLLLMVTFFHIRKGGCRRLRFSASQARLLLKHGSPMMLTGIFLMIYMRIDQVMIEHFMGEREVGLYAVAVRLSEAWYFLPSVLAASFFPAILAAKRENREIYRGRLQRLYEVMTWLGLGLAIPTTFLAPLVIRLLYGAEFAPAAIVLSLYIWAGVFIFQAIARGKWIIAEGLQAYALVFTIIATTVNVVLNLVFIPRFGLPGAALATVVSCCFQSILAPAIFTPTRTSAIAILRSFVPTCMLQELKTRIHPKT